MNKSNISIYLVNEEATTEFNKIYYEYNEDVFDNNGKIITDYIIPDGNNLLGYYSIKNNWEETFFAYIIINDEGISIGKYIEKIKKQRTETGIIVTCFLDNNGNRIFYEFTSNNIGKNLAIVFNNKIIVCTRILNPIQNSISCVINY
jgi:preprotein translocase subunit SecD